LKNLSSSGLKLDEDIILDIFLYLTPQEIDNARIAGVANVDIPNIFWRRKIRIDFPWVWNLPDANAEGDWHRIYNDLVRFSQGELKGMILGLANRRRIWNVCSQLADLYLERIRLSSTEYVIGSDEEEIVQNSFCVRMQLVRAPASRTFTPMTSYFIDSWKGLNSDEKAVTVFMNDYGYISGISLGMSSDVRPPRLFGVETDVQYGKYHRERIFSSDWITGFELNIERIDFSRQPCMSAITGVKVRDIS
jgi:hypothetical protein